MKLSIEQEDDMGPDKSLQTFISYSRVNQQFAIKLTCELKSAGFCVWMDQFDIPTGARWDDEIEKALRECQIFLFIMTPDSMASENAKDEVGYAIDHGKRILPVLLEECEIPLRLRRLQYVDFTKKSFNEGIASAKELLSKLVDEIGTTATKAVEPAYEINTRKQPTSITKEPKTAPTPKRVESHQIQPVSKRHGKSSSMLRTAAIGIGSVGILIAAAIILQPLFSMHTSTISPTAITAPTQTTIPTTSVKPPIIPVMPTTAILRSFTEDFNSSDPLKMDWTSLLRHGDLRKESDFKYATADGNLVVDLTHEFVWGYFLYTQSAIYNNVELEVIVADLRSTGTFGLICQFGDKGWYEFDINGGGEYFVRFVDSIQSNQDEDRFLIKNGSIPSFKYSTEKTSENNIRVNCDGNYLSLSINGTELMKDFPSRFKLEQGQIGFSIRSYKNYPVHVVVNSITVREPQD